MGLNCAVGTVADVSTPADRLVQRKQRHRETCRKDASGPHELPERAELIFNTAASIACHPKKSHQNQKKSLAVTYGTFKTGHFSHTQSHWPQALKVSLLCSGPSFAQIHWL
eukprot:s1060_g4.t1